MCLFRQLIHQISPPSPPAAQPCVANTLHKFERAGLWRYCLWQLLRCPFGSSTARTTVRVEGMCISFHVMEGSQYWCLNVSMPLDASPYAPLRRPSSTGPRHRPPCPRNRTGGWRSISCANKGGNPEEPLLWRRLTFAAGLHQRRCVTELERC